MSENTQPALNATDDYLSTFVGEKYNSFIKKNGNLS